ncbi:5-methylcytosine-specific restriction endonuclease McrA [Luteibacter sp. HA06]
MADWIDLATINDERRLSAAIDALTAQEGLSLRDTLCALLFITPLEVEKSVLRILVERSRAMALPKALWSRSFSDSSSVDELCEEYLASLGVPSTKARVAAMRGLYRAFGDTRSSQPPLTIAMLNAIDWRCTHCGLLFCDDDVVHKGWSSPHGPRGPLKVEPLKQHWNPALAHCNYRQPSIDHDWPVSTFGDNAASNLRIMCRGCNEGKSNIVAGEQAQSWVGMHRRSQFLPLPLPLDVFYAQLRRRPRCEITGQTASQIELTVKLRDPGGIARFDNLITVESP